MSREAFEAVQDHSAVTDPTGLNILFAIARFIPATGEPTGWASDRTLAKLAHCDKDTIAPWRARLEALGEIESRLTGAGRGMRRYYRLLLPMNQPDESIPVTRPFVHGPGEGDIPAPAPAESSRPEPDNSAGEIARLAALISELMSRIEALTSQLAQTMSRENVPIVPLALDRQADNTTNTPSTVSSTRGRAARVDSRNPPRTPPAPPAAAPPQGVAGGADQRLQAIVHVCGLNPAIPQHRRKAEWAAAQLSGYTPAQILARYGPPSAFAPPGEGKPDPAWYWYRDDWRGLRGEQPTPADVVQNITRQAQPEARALSAGGQSGAGPVAGGSAAGRPLTNAEKAALEYARLKQEHNRHA